MLSPALKTDSRAVFFIELGLKVLTSWRFSLKLPRPLSSPSFSQSSFEGMDPPCHVKPGSVLEYSEYYCMLGYNYLMLYVSCLSTRSAIAAMRLGRYTKGTSLISSLPLSEEIMKAPLSATKLSPTMPFANFLCCRSLAMATFKDFNHLCNNIINKIMMCVLLIIFVTSSVFLTYSREFRGQLSLRGHDWQG